MLEILQVPPFLAAEICELGMVISYNNASGFLLGTVWLADFWQISQNYVTQDPDPKRKTHGKSTPHVSVQVNCGFLAYCASWLKVQVSC